MECHQAGKCSPANIIWLNLGDPQTTQLRMSQIIMKLYFQLFLRCLWYHQRTPSNASFAVPARICLSWNRHRRVSTKRSSSRRSTSRATSSIGFRSRRNTNTRWNAPTTTSDACWMSAVSWKLFIELRLILNQATSDSCSRESRWLSLITRSTRVKGEWSDSRCRQSQLVNFGSDLSQPAARDVNCGT